MASVPDSTDYGTRRPIKPPLSQSGTVFQPLIIPQRNKIINPIAILNANNPFILWQLFFPPEHINIIMIYTNSNAALYYKQSPDRLPHAREWQQLTMNELYAYFAILIYIGIHKEPRITDYWNNQLNKPLHPIVYHAISCNRFQQIDRFFHVSNPEKSIPGNPFSKLEPLNGHIMSTAKAYWQAGRDLAVDECMQRFQGMYIYDFDVYIHV